MNFKSIKGLPEITLGTTFERLFGDEDVSITTSKLFSTQLTESRSVTEIVKAVTPVTLSDVYSFLPQIKDNFLTVIIDSNDIPQIVYIYVSGKTMVATSPPSPQVPRWEKGRNIYSSAPITNL